VANLGASEGRDGWEEEEEFEEESYINPNPKKYKRMIDWSIDLVEDKLQLTVTYIYIGGWT
jgi:hypothetical protein